MATKAATKTKQETEKPEAGQATEAPDSPLLDLSDAAVKKLIKVAKKRGYVTYEELNSVMPSEEVSTDQIEDIMAMFSDMGINVVDEDEVEEAEPDTPEEESTELAEKTGTAVVSKSNAREGSDRTDDPVRSLPSRVFDFDATAVPVRSASSVDSSSAVSGSASSTSSSSTTLMPISENIAMMSSICSEVNSSDGSTALSSS